MSNTTQWTVMPKNKNKNSRHKPRVCCNRINKLVNLTPIEKQIFQKIINDELCDYIDTEIKYIKHTKPIPSTTKVKMLKWLQQSKLKLKT